MASGVVYHQVYVYKRDGTSSDSSWSSVALDISNFVYDISIKKGIQSIKDTFTFRMNDSTTNYLTSTPLIEYADLVQIWMKRDSESFGDQDLLIEGIIESVTLDFGTEGRQLVIKGNDFFETIFDVQVPVGGLEGKEKTWKEILKGLINRWEFKNRNLYWDNYNDLIYLNRSGTSTSIASNKLNDSTATFVTWGVKVGMLVYNKSIGQYARITVVNSNTQLTLNANIFTTIGNSYSVYGGVGTPSNGSSFKKINFALDYTPFSQIVEKLTSNENTGDGQYIYYITARTDPVDGIRKRYLTIRNGQENDVLGEFYEGILTNDIRSEKGTVATKNFIIFEAGNDLNGNPIQDVYYDVGSIGKIGFKYYHMIEETNNISEVIMQTEADLNYKFGTPAKFNYDGTKWTSDNHFPTSYPYTWKQELANNTVTSTSDSDFNDDLADLSKQLAKAIARDYANGTIIPKYDVTMVFKFRNDFILGGLYNVYVPSRGIYKKLRITEADFSLVETKLKFEEDNLRATLD